MSHWYLDTSAAVKMILDEKESDALELFLVGATTTSSALTRLEVARVLREESDESKERADLALAKILMSDISQAVLVMAKFVIENKELKPADAIHVATALLADRAIDGLITYDKQMAIAATRLGIRTETPE